jgi:hypothetical protein
MRRVNNIAVYYDRSGLMANAEPARLDYQRIGLSRSTGIFHPKNIFVLLKNRDGEPARESLLVITLSANLTRSGWWENVEVAHIEEIKEQQETSLREDLRDLIARIKRIDKAGREHSALDAIRTFLSRRVDRAKRGSRRGRWLARLYVGQQSVPEFLSQFVRAGQFNLEIISPYFEDTAKAYVLDSLLKTLRPKETRLYLPESNDGAVMCQERFFVATERLGARWSKLPTGPLRPPQADKGVQRHRFVHAKVYRFWNQKREIFFVGSVNLTQAAHQSARGGNFETGILVESETFAREWWLEPIDGSKPAEFSQGDSEDGASSSFNCYLSLRFNWTTNRLDYFWETVRGVSPQQATILSQGIARFEIKPIVFDQWIELSTEAAKTIKKLLISSSLVDVTVDSGSSFRILVEEEGMAQKPSILLNLSPEEILQYWSLLSPEQREEFISVRAANLAEGTEYVLPLAPLIAGNTMFDRFAGIFHAFGRLEHHITDALDNHRENEAIYRLFGQKYDSLPSLIEKVADNEKADRVNRYVTLLCAKQLLSKLEDKYPEFRETHLLKFAQIYHQLTAIDQIRAGFIFDSEPEQQRFFNWFERMFFLEIPVRERK